MGSQGAIGIWMNRVTIRNNSVQIGAKSRGGVGIHLGKEGTGLVLASNAVQYLGADKAFACFDLDLPPKSYAAADNNLCHAPAAAGFAWAKGKGNLAAWQASSRLDQHSLVEDPGFGAANAPGYDLLPLAPTSPLFERGHPTASAPTSFGGTARSPKPDIGAHQRP
jgi:hypothetical protein